MMTLNGITGLLGLLQNDIETTPVSPKRVDDMAKAAQCVKEAIAHIRVVQDCCTDEATAC